MIEDTTLQLVLRFVSAIIILWYATIYIRQYHIAWPFLPLLIFFIALALAATSEFYELYTANLHVVRAVIFLTFYAWLLAVMIRIARKYNVNN